MSPYVAPEPPPLDPVLEGRARARLDGLAKPPGALGGLERLAVRLATVRGSETPRLQRVAAYVFAADHGLTAEGVSAYPSSVTAAMAATILAGRASVSALARACDVEVRVVDAGVDAESPAHPDLLDAKVRRGTRNAAVEPALAPDEAAEALRRGEALGRAAVRDGVDAVIAGEMGIGNTASAALLTHRLAPAPLDLCVGLGAGHTAEGLAHKLAVCTRAAARSAAADPFEALCEWGGLEIAAMAGCLLGVAAERGVAVVDGFISSAAALVAVRLRPELAGRLVYAHRGAERGHALLLDALGAEPLLTLDLRLGEGTGGVLAAPLLRAAARLFTDVASLQDVLDARP